MPCASVNMLEPRLEPSPCDYYYIEVKIKLNHRHLSLAYCKSVNYQLRVCALKAESSIKYTNTEESQGCNLHLESNWLHLRPGNENTDTLQIQFQLRIQTVLLSKYAWDKRCCELNGFNGLLHQTQINLSLIPHHLHTSVACLSQPINPEDKCGHSSVSSASKPRQLRSHRLLLYTPLSGNI